MMEEVLYHPFFVIRGASCGDVPSLPLYGVMVREE